MSLLSLLGLLILTACNNTQMVGTWKSPSYAGGPLNNILVIGLGNDSTVSRMFEDSFVNSLAARGVKATQGYIAMNGAPPTEGNIKRAVAAGKYSAVIVTTKQKQETQTQYVPGTTYFEPMYYGMYPYVASTYTMVQTPGYFQNVNVLYILTKVYSTANSSLIWSGNSESFNPQADQSTINGLVSTLVSSMSKDGLIGR
ncbi:hypothetical protein QPK87_23875 [Kamptonema cortianum]|nr:hypothetical protein [Kamptonema cortianum]